MVKISISKPTILSALLSSRYRSGRKRFTVPPSLDIDDLHRLEQLQDLVPGRFKTFLVAGKRKGHIFFLQGQAHSSLQNDIDSQGHQDHITQGFQPFIFPQPQGTHVKGVFDKFKTVFYYTLLLVFL